jgi:hypothetical protein
MKPDAVKQVQPASTGGSTKRDRICYACLSDIKSFVHWAGTVVGDGVEGSGHRGMRVVTAVRRGLRSPESPLEAYSI